MCIAALLVLIHTKLDVSLCTLKNWSLCNGCLRICQILNNPQKMLRVWELKDYDEKGGQWCLEKEVYLHQMVLEKYCKRTRYRIDSPILAYHPKDTNIEFCGHRKQEQQRTVVSCNMRRKTLEAISDIQSIYQRYTDDVFTFVLPWRPTPIPFSPS